MFIFHMFLFVNIFTRPEIITSKKLVVVVNFLILTIVSNLGSYI